MSEGSLANQMVLIKGVNRDLGVEHWCMKLL